MGVSQEPQAKSTRTFSLCCCGACSFVTIALGVLLVLLGVWFAHLYERFTPVYQTIECKLEPPKLERMWFDHGLVGMHLQLITNTTCSNPNPYSVTVRSPSGGAVFMGHGRTPVGAVTDIPAATLPAGGNASIEANITITPTAKVFGSFFELIGAGHIPIYLENNMDLKVDIDLLFGNFSSRRSFSKDCGMNFRMVAFMRPELGPMACADSWDDLVLPSDGSGGADGMAFTAEDMADEEIRRATVMKNTSLGIGMGVGFGLGLVLLVCGAIGAARVVRGASCGARAPAVADDGVAENSTKDVAPARVISDGGARGRGAEEVV